VVLVPGRRRLRGSGRQVGVVLEDADDLHDALLLLLLLLLLLPRVHGWTGRRRERRPCARGGGGGARAGGACCAGGGPLPRYSRRLVALVRREQRLDGLARDVLEEERARGGEVDGGRGAARGGGGGGGAAVAAGDLAGVGLDAGLEVGAGGEQLADN